MSAICPKCKEKIECLNYSRSGCDNGELSIDKDGFEEYNEDSNSDLIEPELIFSCPECNEELDFSEDEAIKFLKEKDEFQELIKEKINKMKKENGTNKRI